MPGNLNYSPDERLALSVILGVDMTPNGDLEDRLDAVIKASEDCRQQLDVVAKNLLKYAETVKGLDANEILASSACEVAQDQNAMM
jgi:hypothetical protein